jgi:serine/threonine protein kinase
MWSVGCIFAELLLKEPLFQAQNEMELLSMIFKLLGPPTNNSWPGYSSLPLAKTLSLPSPQPSQFRQKFQYLTTAGIDLMMSLLTYDPERRISAEEALQHPYFTYVYLGVEKFACSLRFIQRVAASEASRFIRVFPLCCCWRKVRVQSHSFRVRYDTSFVLGNKRFSVVRQHLLESRIISYLQNSTTFH